MGHRIWRIGLIFTAALWACDTGVTEPSLIGTPATLTSPPSDEQEGKDQPEGRTVGERPAAVVSSEVTVSGSLRPGDQIVVTGRISANVPSRDLKLRIWSPELAFANESSFDERYRVKTDGAIPYLSEEIIPGELGTVEHTVTAAFAIPAAGIYEVVLSAQATPLAYDFGVNDVAHESVWIFVDEDRGRIVTDFALDSVPDGFIQETGPFRRAEPSGGPAVEMQGAPLLVSGGGQIKVYVYYVDQDDEPTVVPVAGTRVTLFELNAALDTVSTPSGITNSSGIATIDCTDDHTIEIRDIKAWLNGSKVTMVYGQDIQNVSCGDPAPTYNRNVYDGGEVFMNYEHEIIPDVENLFDDSRSKMKVKVYGSTGTSNYSRGPDDIELYSNAVWGDWGLFVQAHEYGHAFHEKALGGNEGSGQCNGDHTFILKTNYQCAFSEGFADFVGMALGYVYFRTDSSVRDKACLDYDFETSTCNSWGPQGAYLMETEDAVMLFLNDVIDASNSESLNGVSYDQVTVSAPHLADIYETCVVSSERPDRIYWLTHCIQREIDGYPEDFPGARPSSYSVSAGHSPDQDDVRQLWRTHLRYKTTLYDFSVSVSVQDTGEPFSWVTATAVLQNGISPFTYSWKINGSPACGNESTCQGQLGGAGTFTTFKVTVTDATSDQATAQKSVMAEHDECPDCMALPDGDGRHINSRRR